MEYELVEILGLIRNKIGKDVGVISETDEKFYSTKEGDLPDKPEYKVVGVMPDSIRKKTYFRFRRKSENYIGYIEGDGEAERGFAALIATLLESSVIREASGGKGDSLRNIVLGESSGIQIQKYMRKYGISDTPCCVLVIMAPEGKQGDALNFLTNFKSNEADKIGAVDETSIAYIRFQDVATAENEYQSITDYAFTLVQSIEEELGIAVKIGVGSTVKSFSECSVSYQQAVSSVRTGWTFDTKSPVTTYKDFILVRMLEDLPKYKLQEFLDILLEPEAKTIFGDAEMIGTAEEFLCSNLNVSETSRNLYMHRNTLMYRLDKIARSTGLDIRKFQDAVTFRLITILYKLLG